MLKSPFFRQIFLPYLLLIAVTTLAFGGFAAVWLRGSYIESLEAAMLNEAKLVADLSAARLEPAQRPALQDEVGRFGVSLGRRITLIDADGTVLADNEADPAHMENHGARPEILQAKADGHGMSIRPSDTIHVDLLYVAHRAQAADGSPFFVRLSYHLTDLRTHLRVLYSAVAIAALAAIGAAGVISFYLARRRAAPLVELTDFANALANGDLDRRILQHEQGEMGRLANSLNKMADSLVDLLSQMAHDKAELLTILASMSDGVIVTDTHQRITLVNQAAAHLLDFSNRDAPGKLLWEVVRMPPLLKAAPQALESRRREVIQLNPTPRRHLEITLSVYPADGAIQGLILVVHDISQSRRYEELRKEFVANVSHELRTPLSVIKGFVETLRDGALAEPTRARQYLATIEKHTDQLSNLVSDLLELSRLESQPGPMRTTRLDVSSVLHRAIDLLMPAAQRKSQNLALSVVADLPTVIGNADYLERAVTNLVDNAIKYTPEHGQITVSAQREDQLVCIEVADDGIGVPPDDLPRIFERFYRVDRSRSREMGGTGLGLSIVKHVAQAHGGSVEVSSIVGAGSVFRLKLPVAPVTVDADATAAPVGR